LYVPKQVLFGEILGGYSPEWFEAEAADEAPGEIELGRSMVDHLGRMTFVDLREQQLIICQCGCITAPLAIMRQAAANGGF
jgi:hypothetical protein